MTRADPTDDLPGAPWTDLPEPFARPCAEWAPVLAFYAVIAAVAVALVWS